MKSLNTGHLRTNCFARYSRHVRYLRYQLLGGFTVFSFALCSWFFTEEFSQYVACRCHSFMTFTKNKEGEGVGVTKFQPVLLLAFDSCGRRHVRLVNLFLSVTYKDFLH